jgi:hypothetical protein
VSCRVRERHGRLDDRGYAHPGPLAARRPRARIGEFVGQRNLAVTANTYSHVLPDEVELDYAVLLEEA